LRSSRANPPNRGDYEHWRAYLDRGDGLVVTAAIAMAPRLDHRFEKSSLLLLDRYGLRGLVRGRATSLDRTAVAFSHIGRGGLVWIGLAALVGSGRRPLRRRDGILLSACATGSALAVSTLLARALQRPRPCERGVRSLIPCPEGGSLPSDQVAAAFAAAEMLGWSEPQARIWLRAAAIAIALSRVAVGVHYPTDALAGALIGVATGRSAKTIAARRARRAMNAPRKGTACGRGRKGAGGRRRPVRSARGRLSRTGFDGDPVSWVTAVPLRA
jgi:undecaprenyl-diphosphatase